MNFQINSVIIASILIAVASIFFILWVSLKIRILCVEKKSTILGLKNKSKDAEYQQGHSIARNDGFSKLSRDQSSSINYQSSVPSMNTQVEILEYFRFSY